MGSEAIHRLYYMCLCQPSWRKQFYLIIPYMPINHIDHAGSMYGVDVSESVGGLTTLTFGILDKKGTFFQLKHDDDWIFNSIDWSHYFWTAAGYNALIFILLFVIVKQMNNVLN